MSGGKRKNLPYKLPSWEVGTYFFVWTTLLAYLMYSIYKFTQENQNLFLGSGHVDGWWFLGGKKDENDFEFDFWKRWIGDAWIFIFGHIILGQMCRPFNFETRRYSLILYDICAIGLILSPYAVAFVALNCLAVGIVAQLTRSMAAVWSLLCCLIYLFQWEYKYPDSSYAMTIKWLCYHDFDKIIALRYSTFFAYLKMASFSHELITEINRKEGTTEQDPSCDKDENKRDEQVNLSTAQTNSNSKCTSADKTISSESVATMLNIVLYMFYLPTYFIGPLITFKDFNEQITAPILPWSKDRVYGLVLECLRVAFWAFILELTLHFMFIHSIQNNEIFLENLTSPQLVGEVSAIILFFYVKYVVLYGLPGVVARCDQLTVPYTPACFHATYKYSEDWRLFDRGLYAILMRHIYIPLGGSRHGPLWQLLAAISCFSFTCFWHGAMDYVFAWTALNVFIVSLEALALYLVSRPRYLEFEKHYLSPAMARRLSTLFWIPMRLLHTLATLTFIAGINLSLIFVKKMFVEGFPGASLFFILIYYFLVQICMECHLRRHERENGLKNKED